MTTNVVDMVRDTEPKFSFFIGERFAPQPPHPSSKVSGMIDLGEYDDPGPIKTRTGKIIADFQYHKFLDLDTIDTDDEIFNQVGTKQGDVEEYEIDAMVEEMRLHGFVKEEKLPQYDENGHPINGRIRTKAMKRKSQDYPQTVYGVDGRWLPISCYKWRENVTLREKKVSYGRLNITLPHTIQNQKTFIKEGVDLCALGELDPFDRKDVDNYVRYESAAGEKWSDDVSGVLTKIVNKIMKLGQNVNNGIANTKCLSREGWVQKVTEDGHQLQNKKLVLSCADEVTYVYRALTEHIMPAVENDQPPVKFILYTNKDDANEAKEAIQSFGEKLEKLWGLVFTCVGKKTKTYADYEDFDMPFVILGAVPQVIGQHNLESAKLIPIDKY